MDLKWPLHDGSLHLSHNENKSDYETVAEAIRHGRHGYDDDCWVSDEQRQKAIDTNECWTLQWYPSSPVGFCILSAADLDVLLIAAQGTADVH